MLLGVFLVKMLSFAVEDKMAETIDLVVSKSGNYSSRSEFLKDSVRLNLVRQTEVEGNMKDFLTGFSKLRKKAYAKGYDGHLPTQEEKAKIAMDYFKEKRIDINKYLQ